MSTGKLSGVELAAALRHLRARRDALFDDLLLLEERERAGEDGAVRGAILALAADISVLDDVIRHLWYLQLRG